LRAITGSLNKNKTGRFNLTTPVSSIGIRGTDFTAILCTKDCEDTRSSTQQHDTSKSKVVARLIVAKGNVEALNPKGDTRQLQKHSPIYAGDRLITGNKSIAVVVFKDNTRTTIQGNTEFIVNEYLFNPDKATDNKADFHLLKGSLRVLTGKIGKLNRKDYTLSTPNSSIGIRGTGFDLAYITPTYLFLWDGTVQFVYPKGKQLIQTGETFHLADKHAQLKQIDKMPVRFQQGPRPDSKEIDEQADLDELFGARKSSGEPGLYLYVGDGEIEVKNRVNRLNIGAGEGGFVQADVQYRLDPVPAFLFFSVIPPNADQQTLQRMHVLPETFDELNYIDDGMICEIR